MAVQTNFETQWVSSCDVLKSLAENLLGVASYLRVHRDRDSVQLVLTEPGQKSALRRAIDDSGALPPVVFQTSDAFFSLARAATDELTVLSPFLDQQGADFLVELFALCSDGVRRSLICRPLNEPECGVAFRRRASDFRRLSVSVYEYALPSLLPSGRETFHAKVVLADASSFYVGSSNFIGSALDRSFECGVIVRGETARQLRYMLAALQSIASCAVAIVRKKLSRLTPRTRLELVTAEATVPSFDSSKAARRPLNRGGGKSRVVIGFIRLNVGLARS
jgi:phosphatidylserine/phosphatidylglycerophosphate/cardiolipin synthase-like enzyme